MDFAPNVVEALRREALSLGVETPALQAVVVVEGQAVDMADGLQDGKVDGYCMIRWEGHYFWRYLPETKRAQAQRAGLASPRAGAIKNPYSMQKRHEMLHRAMQIDETAALKSISMGVGQVMGANYAMCGYASVQDMWQVAQDLAGQVQVMARFIKAAGLADELQRLDWAGFARGYNGPSYRTNRYDTKMETAYKQFGGTRSGSPAPVGFLKLGMHGDEVRALQGRLTELGYIVSMDGDFGPDTKSAVRLFQLEHDLSPDGVVGTLTRDKLAVAAPRPRAQARASATEQDIKSTSRIVSNGAAIRNVAAVGSVAIGGVKAVDESGVLDTISQVGGYASQVQEALGPIGAVVRFAADNWWIAALVAGVAIAFWASRVVQARVEDQRSGKTT